MPKIIINHTEATKGHTMNYRKLVLLFIALLMPLLITSTPAMADFGQDSICGRNIAVPTTTPGVDIVRTVFKTIEAVLNSIGKTMYKGIVDNTSFQTVLGTSLSLYVALYGIMIMLNLAPLRFGDVVGRLIRIAIVYSLLWSGTTGWIFFDQYFRNLFLGGMNELIFDFATAAGVPTVPPITVSGFGTDLAYGLDINAVAALFEPMNMLFKPAFSIAILGMARLNLECAVLALCMVWAFYNFVLMVVGALMTYIRAIVGLTFLFGIAPFFIIFLLFGHTRNLFFGWVNQVVAMAIAPVLLFAFLSFYTVLLTSVIGGLLQNVDFCWAKEVSVASTLTDVYWYKPAIFETLNGQKQWVLHAGRWEENGIPKAPPISVVNILMFLVIAHLGKNFCDHIGQLARSLSEGIGPGITTGAEIGGFLENKMTGGRGYFNAAAGAFSKAGSAAKSAGAAAGLAGVRAGGNRGTRGGA